MKAFVTGGTGFIGRHLVRLLVEQGHDVLALAGDRPAEQTLRTLGATPVPGEVSNTSFLQAGMAGCDTVFHAANHQIAGSAEDALQASSQIVTGTRNTLSSAFELGIPRIVYIGSTIVFGDTQGHLVDETYTPAQPPHGEIGRAMWRAHYEVVLPLIEQGAPIIIAMPGSVYGPGDTGWMAHLMRRFYRGSLPLVPAPETTLTYAYVEDVVRGCILAAEKGRPGEAYCLTGPAIPLGELLEFWSQLTGRRAPSVSLSWRTLQSITPVLDTMAGNELAAYLGGTYTASSDKARNELGWSIRSIQTTTLETFEWIAATEPADTWENRRHLGFLALGGAVGLLALWFLLQRGNQSTES
ncbi:MAG: NAD-dependent epimerase/dehydratase family protein [Chloroflexota bacterium]